MRTEHAATTYRHVYPIRRGDPPIAMLRTTSPIAHLPSAALQSTWLSNLNQLVAAFPSLLLLASLIGVHEQSLHGILKKRRPLPRSHVRIIERTFGLAQHAFDVPLSGSEVSGHVREARREWIAKVCAKHLSIHEVAHATGVGFKTLAALAAGRIPASGPLVELIAKRTQQKAPPSITVNETGFRLPGLDLHRV